MIDNIDYHIIDRCNLNCASCNHFSSLAPFDDNGKSIEQITADIALQSKLKAHFNTISILGGESTLHPQLSKILKIGREFLPENEIHMVTNGTKFEHFERWKDALAETRTIVYVTLYPYCEDYSARFDKIYNTLSPEVAVYYAGCDGFSHPFLSNPEYGNQEHILGCWRRTHCPQLKNGKLYLCNLAAQFNVLKDHFGDQVEFDLRGDEYLNLNGEVTEEKLHDFIFQACPGLCNHCVDMYTCETLYPWTTTKGDIEEWVEK